MDLPAIIIVDCQYCLRQFIPGTCIICDPTGVVDSLLVTKYSSILNTRRSNIGPENLCVTTNTLERGGSNIDAIEE